MNKTAVYVIFASLIALTLVETLIILAYTPQHFTTFSSFMLVLLGLASTFAVTMWGLNKQNEEIKRVKHETSTKLDVVQSQTNGTLTRLINQGDEKTLIIHEQSDELRKKDAEIAELRIMAGLPPVAILKGNPDE